MRVRVRARVRPFVCSDLVRFYCGCGSANVIPLSVREIPRGALDHVAGSENPCIDDLGASDSGKKLVVLRVRK